jgi:hypothetical protein
VSKSLKLASTLVAACVADPGDSSECSVFAVFVLGTLLTKARYRVLEKPVGNFFKILKLKGAN